MRYEQGFTLIELMITVLIIGILAAIAVPQYRAYVERAACEDGKSLLTQASANMERWRARNNGSYATGNPDVGLPAATSEFGVPAISNRSATSYTLTTTAIGVHAGGTLSITAANARGGSLAGECNW